MLCSDGKERFPRLLFPRLESKKHDGHVALRPGHRENFGHGRKVKYYKEMIAAGKLPRGWERLDAKKKKLAKRVASGMSVVDACKLLHVETTNFYIWRECHPLFRKYLQRYAAHYANRINLRIDAKLPRAVRVVEDSLESRDPYFAHEAAVQLLKGRGVYKPTTNVQGEVVNRQVFEGSVNVKHSHKLDKEFATMFVDALKAKAQGTELKRIKPKIIDVEVVKELPPAQGIDAAPLQESRPKASVEKD